MGNFGLRRTSAPRGEQRDLVVRARCRNRRARARLARSRARSSRSVGDLAISTALISRFRRQLLDRCDASKGGEVEGVVATCRVVLTERASPAEAGVDTDDFALGARPARGRGALRVRRRCAREGLHCRLRRAGAEFGPKRAGQAGMRHERDAGRAGDRGSEPQLSIIEPATHEVDRGGREVTGGTATTTVAELGYNRRVAWTRLSHRELHQPLTGQCLSPRYRSGDPVEDDGALYLVSAIEPLAAGVETLVSAEVVRSARPDPFGSPFALTWEQLTRMDKGR
ncbi:MAG: hypothetical protein QOE57_2959 [Acidimicrobiaceae bacterium]|nr:hypothetical protein [Acidimicrobiaceae bacterium]